MPFTLSFAKKISLFSLLIITLVGSGIATLSVATFRQQLVQSYIDAVAGRLELTATALATPLMDLDEAAMTRELKNLLTLTGVIEAVVVNQHGLVLSDGDSGRYQWLQPLPAEKIAPERLTTIEYQEGRIMATHFIKGQDNRVLGLIHIEYSGSTLEEALDKVFNDALILTFFFLVAGTGLAWLLGWQMVQPLKPILAALDQIGQGNLLVDLAGHHRDEFGLLARGINRMALNLRTSMTSVAELNHEIMQRRKVQQGLKQALEQVESVNQRMQSELNLARSMQLAILPNHFIANSQWAVHAHMESAREMGGDFYDVIALPNGYYGLVVADVSGKGVPAAFFMATSRTVLLELVREHTSPAVVLDHANQYLCQHNPMEFFITLCYARYHPESGALVYASAGHPAPFIRHVDGQVEALPSHYEIALGLFEEATFTDLHYTLQPQEKVLLFSDGVTEAYNPNEEFYGEERLTAWFSHYGHEEPIQRNIEHLMETIQLHVDDAEPSDDITCLIWGRY